jgi:hypothetical protein
VLDDDKISEIPTENIPKNCPDHFEETIKILNWCLLPSLKVPKELMLGLVVNTKPADLNNITQPVTEADTTLQMVYVAHQRLDGYAEAVAHVLKGKSAFDRKVLARKPGEVVFSKGQSTEAI